MELVYKQMEIEKKNRLVVYKHETINSVTTLNCVICIVATSYKL
jgi:hypothetical protein